MMGDVSTNLDDWFTTSDELKACPFCGGEALPQPERSARFPGTAGDDDDPDAWAYWFACRSCAAVGGWAKTPGNARRNWNMRTAEAA